MAKSKSSEVAEPEAPAPEATGVDAAPAPAPESAPAPVVWRTVALCQRSQTVAFPQGVQRYLGGEIEDQPARVEVLRACEHWSLIDIESPEQLDDLRASLASEVEDLRARAARIGYDLVQSGSAAR